MSKITTSMDKEQRSDKEAQALRQPAVENTIGNDEMFRLLLNSTGEGIYGVDLDGNCTFANPSCARLLGYESVEELLGQHMHNLVHHTLPNGDPYPVEECRIYQAYRDHQGINVDDEVMFSADGSSFPAEYWSYPVERDGELVGCVVTFVDISERRRVEEELRQADEMFRLLLNSTGEGIYGVDLDGNCTFANPSCAKLLGYESVDQLLGKHMHNLVHHTLPNGEPYPVEECRIYQAYREHQGINVDDEVMFSADGASFPAEYWSYPVERDGELVGCVVTFVDITERRRVEEELRQTEKMAALGKLSAGLAHELNNPAAAAGRAAGQLVEALDELQSANIKLARMGIESDQWDSLIGQAREFRERSANSPGLSPLEASDHEEELLSWLEAHNIDDGWWMASTLVTAGVQNDELDAIAAALPADLLDAAVAWLCRVMNASDHATDVVKSTHGISDLVNVFKSYSYMDQAPLQYIDIHTGIEDTITILGHRLKPGIEIVRQYDRDLPQVYVPGHELNQVWTNIIDNAIDAMGEQGTLTIRTYREGEQAIVEIADNGPGIPEDIQPRIFDPFFTTKDVGEGTGLGLDVARRIVTNRCDGEINFSCSRSGTVFRVRIPIASERSSDSTQFIQEKEKDHGN